jgi:hypothetical protein
MKGFLLSVLENAKGLLGLFFPVPYRKDDGTRQWTFLITLNHIPLGWVIAAISIICCLVFKIL